MLGMIAQQISKGYPAKFQTEPLPNSGILPNMQQIGGKENA
jgi:hypothetical protein